MANERDIMPQHERKQQVMLANGVKVTYSKPSPLVAHVLKHAASPVPYGWDKIEGGGNG